MCPHWRHLANTTELVLPSVHLSPRPKQQIDRFSRFFTAHGRSPYTLEWAPLSPKLPLPIGDLKLHLTHDSFGPSEPTTQTASRSVHPFLHRWSQSVSLSFTMGRPLPSKLPFPWGCWPSSNTTFLGPTRVLNPNRMSIASAVFAGFTSVTDRPTNRPTKRPCYSIGNNRPHRRTYYCDAA